MASKVALRDGAVRYGRLIWRNARELAIATDPYDLGRLTTIPTADVADVALSQVSMMPPATIAAMNRDEVMDLVAYLVSGGDRKHAVFQPR
jgi:hypothetical protein